AASRCCCSRAPRCARRPARRWWSASPRPASRGCDMALDFPFRIDSRGRSAEVGGDAQIRDMIEQVLFTIPGERVNRPDFGCGLLQLVFAPNSDALAAALQMTVQGSLQQWLGELIEVEDVLVENLEARLQVTVQYVVRRDRQRQLASFQRILS